MRIRKRQLPLPISSESVSDPLLNQSPVVQLQLQLKGNLFHAADSPNPEPDNINASEEKEEKCNDSRERRSMFGAETRNGFLLESSSSSSQVVAGRWCEREKAFPLKKRRGNFEKWEKEEMDNDVDLPEKNEKKTMKTKMNKKCIDNDRGNNGGGDGGRGGKKRSRSGGALMEGSRCSRVNGRGWRCCQQTLVGYSLCEHHLGKGRLRSMNSVRKRSSAASIAPKGSTPLEDDDDAKKSFTSVTTKKRMKLGVVKARSISSLLDQIDNVGAVAVVAPPRSEDNINK